MKKIDYNADYLNGLLKNHPDLFWSMFNVKTGDALLLSKIIANPWVNFVYDEDSLVIMTFSVATSKSYHKIKIFNGDFLSAWFQYSIEWQKDHFFGNPEIRDFKDSVLAVSELISQPTQNYQVEMER